MRFVTLIGFHILFFKWQINLSAGCQKAHCEQSLKVRLEHDRERFLDLDGCSRQLRHAILAELKQFEIAHVSLHASSPEIAAELPFASARMSS